MVVEIGIPVVVVFVMVAVGLELTPADFRRVRRFVHPIALTLATQWVAVPLLVSGLVLALPMPQEDAVGMLLVAIAPIGSMTNYYALLARADIGLAVSLSAVSNVLALASAPLTAALALHALGGEIALGALPLGAVMKQVALSLVAPILLGMLARRLAPELIARRTALLQRLALGAVVLLVIALLHDASGELTRWRVGAILGLSLLFTLCLLALGRWLAHRVARADGARPVVTFSFPARNYGFAMLLSVQVLGDSRFGVFAAVFFVVQAVVLTSYALVLGRRRPAQPCL